MKKVVLITGASRGIGEATAREFASKGYNVVINYIEQEQRAIKLMKELKDNYSI